MEPIIIDAKTWHDMHSSEYWRTTLGYTLRQKVAEGHKIFFRDELGRLAEINYASIQ